MRCRAGTLKRAGLRGGRGANGRRGGKEASSGAIFVPGSIVLALAETDDGPITSFLDVMGTVEPLAGASKVSKPKHQEHSALTKSS